MGDTQMDTDILKSIGNLRIISISDEERIILHFLMLYNGNRYTTEHYREVHYMEVFCFIVRYIDVPLQHLLAIQDDSISIANRLKKYNVSFPIL